MVQTIMEMDNKMKKTTIKEYETLIEYFSSVRTHTVGTKYNLLELSKSLIEDFTDCINEENRLEMTSFEITQYSTQLELLKNVFDYNIKLHDFAEIEIKRFQKEVDMMIQKGDDEKIN